MIDRKEVFASVRAEFEADHPELAHQIPYWLDIAERSFGERADSIEERVRVLEAAGTPATSEQVDGTARTVARLAFVDIAARWQRGV